MPNSHREHQRAFPYIPPELLRELEKSFPEVSPNDNESWDDLRWRGGQCSVIRFLKRVSENQQKNQLYGAP